MNTPQKITQQAATLPEAPLRLLIVDDDPDDLELMPARFAKDPGLTFRNRHLSPSTAKTSYRRLREQAIRYRSGRLPHAKIGPASTPSKRCSRFVPAVPLILVSGTLGEELAVDCIKLGVTDYVLKHQLARLPMALRRAREEKFLREAETKSHPGTAGKRGALPHPGGECARGHCCDRHGNGHVR